MTASCVTRHPTPGVSIVVPGGTSIQTMSFIRQLIQDVKAGHSGAGYIALELIAAAITVALLVT